MDERIRKFLDAHPSDDLYQHEPLPDGQSFRLIDLFQGQGDDEIALTVANYSITHPPHYEALSYTWGEEVTIEYVRCTGQDLAVTSSLILALKQFRLADRKRMLWIDQCCIDQSNTDERSDQVNLMRQIYKGASRVLSWLGPASVADGALLRKLFKQIDITLDSVAASGRQAHERGAYMGRYAVDPAVAGSKLVLMTRRTRSHWPSDEWLMTYGLPKADAIEWDAFDKFMNNTYFQRIWIVQEIQVGETATIRWGESEFPWVDIHNAARYCLMHGIYSRPGHQHKGWSRYLPPFLTNGQTSLTSYLFMTKYHRCADARDRIFALIGVSFGIIDDSTSKEVNLSIDYKLTWDEVFRNTVMALCRQSQRLDILSNFQHEPIPPNGNLPSWVGKWESDAAFFDFIKGSLVACGNTTPQVEEHLDQNVLIANGIVVDQIVAVNDPFLMPDLALGGLGEVEAYHFEEAWTLVQSHCTRMPRTSAKILDRPLDSLILYKDATNEQNDLRIAKSLNLLSFAHYQLSGAFIGLRGNGQTRDAALLCKPCKPFWPESGIQAALAAFDGRNPTVSLASLRALERIPVAEITEYRRLVTTFCAKSNAHVPDAMLRNLVAAMRTITNHKAKILAEDWHVFNYNHPNLQNMRFFVTSSGNMGIGPNAIKPGDQICILYGGPVPYVIRKIPAPEPKSGSETEEHWFLGGCYLHNMMEGQAMKAQNRDRYPEKTFTFR